MEQDVAVQKGDSQTMTKFIQHLLRCSILIMVVAVVSLLCLGQGQAATLCVDPGTVSCYATIQDAVNDAVPGDKIVIRPNPPKGYTENVVIDTPDLTISGSKRGCGEIVVDTCETLAYTNTCGGHGFEINAPGTTVKNLTFRHGQDINDRGIKINPGGDNATITDCCFIELKEAIEATGPTGDEKINNIEVSRCQFNGIRFSEAVRIDGDDALVRKNIAINTDGIEIRGDRARVERNSMRITTDAGCIEVRGDDARIWKNVLEGCDDEGIEYRGDNGIIRKNRITRVPDDDEGMELKGDNMIVDWNTISVCSDTGMNYSGTAGRIEKNVVEYTGADGDSEPGIQIRGDKNLIIRNTARFNTFSGIVNDRGNENIYWDNECIRNGKSGIRIENGDRNVVAGNRLLKNNGEGINNDDTATNTEITNNLSMENSTDICDDGTINTFSGNTYDTGGPGVPCVVER